MKSIFIVLLLLTSFSWAQTGILQGTVIDKHSQLPLMGATVALLNSNEPKGAITDIDGFFQITQIAVGRQALKISYIGYDTEYTSNIIIDTGKTAVVTIAMVESFDNLSEVIISTANTKSKSINKLATVSARQFGLEEVTRYSGGRSDVGRLAANYAGVSAPDDSRNDIVVRGNAPTGLLWRLEGIAIPNPNHYSTLGTTGGPVSALNPNMLRNSDFFTSAFPAEYGNALGGVFDLGFRKGNTKDYEFSFQTGAFTGLEANAEGPLGNNNGSFLVTGRYSLVGLLGIGAGGTSATPNYKDISFNIDFGNYDFGTLSLFGILATSDIEFLGDDIDADDLFAVEDENSFVDSGVGVIGLKHKLTIGKNSFLQNVIGYSYNKNNFRSDRFIEKGTPNERIINFWDIDNMESRISFSAVFNTKLNKKSILRIGNLLEQFSIDSFQETRSRQLDNDGDGDPDLFTLLNLDEKTYLAQPYILGQYRINKKISFNGGVHGQYSSINDQFVLEPRAGITYKFNKKHQLNVGYGLHHQSVALPILFLNENVNGQLIQTNKNLDFIKSNHFVLGYDYNFASDWRAKLEVYYQDISNAAVESFPSSYSTLTEGANFGFEIDKVSLVNEGTGFNQGVELTIEKFFSKGFYGLLTTSLFESKYKGSDRIERNTPFNNEYVVNALGGKEFKAGKNKKNIFSIDSKITYAGGRFVTPVDLEASRNAGFEELQDNLAFSQKNDSYLRWDLKFGYKINHSSKKQSHQFYVDIQNVTNNDNLFIRRYNRKTNNVDEVNQIGFFPDFGYRFQF